MTLHAIRRCLFFIPKRQSEADLRSLLTIRTVEAGTILFRTGDQGTLCISSKPDACE